MKSYKTFRNAEKYLIRPEPVWFWGKGFRFCEYALVRFGGAIISQAIFYPLIGGKKDTRYQRIFSVIRIGNSYFTGFTILHRRLIGYACEADAVAQFNTEVEQYRNDPRWEEAS